MMFTNTEEYKKAAQEQIDIVFSILEDWYQAIEDGTAHNRLPDVTFEPPIGRPAITEELVEEFVKELDREMDTDALGHQGMKYGADASCEFSRLDYPQRLALVQQLMVVMLSEKEIAQKAEVLRNQPNLSPIKES